MEGKESTRGLCRSCPQALPPAPGWRSSDQADVAANWQDTPARRGVTTSVRGIGVEARVASPEPAVGVSAPAGTCPGRLRRHYVIGYTDPGQNPSAVRSGSSRVRGRDLGRAVVRVMPLACPIGWSAEGSRG